MPCFGKVPVKNLPMTPAKNSTRGYTLVELLIVVALVGVLAAAVLPSFNPSVGDGLTSAAQILASDLAYARSLAVTNNRRYKLTFDTTQNRYVLTHSGSNSLLQVLPPSAFHRTDDAPNQQTTDLDDIPHTGPTAQLLAAQTALLTPVADVEFGPLGGTTRTAATVVWLASGNGNNQRYLSVSIDPITGLAALGDLQANRPTITATTVTLPPTTPGTPTVPPASTTPLLPTGS